MTLCDGCIHDKICGCEGHRDEGMTFCAHKEDTYTRFLIKKPKDCMLPVYLCEKCKGINPSLTPYCAWCGRRAVYTYNFGLTIDEKEE